ncbi:hypothetical protein NTGM5_180058 [Candidatus Nitrotoga sp. M5]|nr:hypothetical protein NTGM5_180058 [Candidatus Nitrotoga sp. M5]
MMPPKQERITTKIISDSVFVQFGNLYRTPKAPATEFMPFLSHHKCVVAFLTVAPKGTADLGFNCQLAWLIF